MVIYMFLKKILSGTLNKHNGIILILSNQKLVKSIFLLNNLGVKNIESS